MDDEANKFSPPPIKLDYGLPDPRTKRYFPTPPERLLKIIIITVAAVVIPFYIYYPFSGAALQRRNMDLAAAHLPKVQPLIQNDVRFKHVQICVYTNYDGCLCVSGYVQTKDMTSLLQIINSTNPPVKIYNIVKAFSPEEYREMEEYEKSNKYTVDS